MFFNSLETKMALDEREEERLMRELYTLEQNRLMAATPPTPAAKDLARISRAAMIVQRDTITYSVNDNRHALIGGRSHSEKVTPMFIDNFVKTFIPSLSCSAAEFLERIGATDENRVLALDEFTSRTPYSFTKTVGDGIGAALDDNVLINTKRGTVLKFLRSKESISGFLLSVYMCSKYHRDFETARCLAYYPGVMCAEYEYAGVNLDMAMSKMHSEGNFLGLEKAQKDMGDIILHLRDYGGLQVASVRPFNFCIDPVSGLVKMTCVEWLKPVYIQ